MKTVERSKLVGKADFLLTFLPVLVVQTIRIYEVRRQFRVKIVTIPIVLETLGTFPAKLSKSLEKTEIDDLIRSLQTAVLISTTAILRRVLNL